MDMDISEYFGGDDEDDFPPPVFEDKVPERTEFFYRLRANTGYQEEGTILDITPEQFGDVVGILHKTRRAVPVNAGILTVDEAEAIRILVNIARKAYHALDDSELWPHGDLVLGVESAEPLEDALAEAEEFPDDKPGYALGAAGKLEWALRRLIGDDGFSQEGRDDLMPAEPAWIRNEEAVYHSLLLVSGHDVPFEAIPGWSDEQCREAEEWATALHLRASDNDVEVPPMPAHVAAYPRKPGCAKTIGEL